MGSGFSGIEASSSILQCKFPPFGAKSARPSVNLPATSHCKQASNQTPASTHHCVTVDKLTDRKSTRLNSSHGYISYALFCFKKKRARGRPPAAGATGVAAPVHAEPRPP